MDHDENQRLLAVAEMVGRAEVSLQPPADSAESWLAFKVRATQRSENGAGGGDRTHTRIPSGDFKSPASAIPPLRQRSRSS